MIRILVVDDHPIVRKGLVEVLAGEPGMEVVGEAATGPEVTPFVRDHAVDVVLLDLNLPGLGGLEVLARLRDLPGPPKVLVFTMYPEKHWAVRSLKEGADGFMTKDKAGTELADAVRTIASGHKYITPSVAELLAFNVSTSAKTPLESLSRRELQVMSLLAEGKTASEVAENLNLSPKTVGTYRSRVLEKLSLKTTADIIRFAIRNGLVE